MHRRSFVKSLAAGLAAANLLPRATAAVAADIAELGRQAAELDGPALWPKLRDEFLLDPGLVHLNCGSLGSTPRRVLDAVAAFARELERHPVHQNWGPLGAAAEQVRQRAAAFLGADADEVAITRNTTEGMNAVASGLGLKTGDEVLTTTHEHHGGMVGWEYLAQHAGVVIRQISMPAPVTDKNQILQRIADAITPRTRVCSLSHVDTITGVRMPLADIAKLTRPKDILLACDGAQAPGMIPVDVKALGVDTYASSSHKWMLAPKGSGLLYIRREIRERIQPPLLHAGYGVYSASSGTRNVPQILGHGVAMDFHDAIGGPRVTDRCRDLSTHLRTRLAEIPQLRLLSPPSGGLSSAMTTYALTEGRAGRLGQRLERDHGIIVKTVPATHVVADGAKSENYNALRFSTHIFNSEAEIDRLRRILGSALKN